MTKLIWILGLIFVVLIGSTFFVNRESTPVNASVKMGQALAGDKTGYDRASGPVPIRFPQDHGPHPGYKQEWWYYTGNVQTASGRRFGYQFTIFRSALAPPDSTQPDVQSAWRTNQLYFAHFALSDIEKKEFYAFERFSRGAAGLAGAQSSPFRVWIEDWSATQVGDDVPPMRIQAAEGDVSVDLTMDLAKPIVLQGNNGYSIKGSEFGNASFYYSMTRLATEGTVTVDDETHEVEGLSWMDREWSTDLLADNQIGWDWFSLHLDDGRELLYFNVRNESDDVKPYSHGALIAQDGSKREPGIGRHSA